MKRALLPLLLLCAPAWGQTTVSQTIIGPDGSLVSGDALIKLSAACRSGSNYATPRGIDVPFTAGAFSVSLVPTDACPVSGGSGSPWSPVTAYAIGARASYSGGVYTATKASTGIVPGSDATWRLISPAYTVQWTSSDNWKWTETWVVPTSATPVTVDSVKVYSAPLPSVPVPGAQGLPFSAAANGVFVLSDPQTVFPLTCRAADIYRNGLLQAEGGVDYSVDDATGLVATFAQPAQAGDVVKVIYRCAGGAE